MHSNRAICVRAAWVTGASIYLAPMSEDSVREGSKHDKKDQVPKVESARTETVLVEPMVE